MECSKCGYALTPFDVDCPRCASGKYRAVKKASDILIQSPEQTVNVQESPQIAPQEQRRQMYLEPRPQHSSSPVDNGHWLLCCGSCRSEGINKISAVWSAGMTMTHGKGTLIADSFSAYSESITFGMTSSTHVSTSRIAQLLSPPNEPLSPRIPKWALIWLTFWLIISGFFLFLVIFISLFAGSSFFVAYMVGGAIVSFTPLALEALLLPSKKRQYLSDRQRWKESIYKWNQLFYCQRCDSVTNVVTGQYAQSGSMGLLL